MSDVLLFELLQVTRFDNEYNYRHMNSFLISYNELLAHLPFTISRNTQATLFKLYYQHMVTTSISQHPINQYSFWTMIYYVCKNFSLLSPNELEYVDKTIQMSINGALTTRKRKRNEIRNKDYISIDIRESEHESESENDVDTDLYEGGSIFTG